MFAVRPDPRLRFLSSALDVGRGIGSTKDPKRASFVGPDSEFVKAPGQRLSIDQRLKMAEKQKKVERQPKEGPPPV